MHDSRAIMLSRIREAVRLGNRTGIGAELGERGSVGYQGCGPDAEARFCEMFVAAGGTAHRVPDATAAMATIVELVKQSGLRRVWLGACQMLDTELLMRALENEGARCVVDKTCESAFSEIAFASDIGITGVDHLIAETGTIVVVARRDAPRSLSLLPPIHIAVAWESQVLPDLFDLFTRGGEKDGATLPSCLTLITGPSKTGDIELKLVTGVHGPKEVHVVLVGGGVTDKRPG